MYNENLGCLRAIDDHAWLLLSIISEVLSKAHLHLRMRTYRLKLVTFDLVLL